MPKKQVRLNKIINCLTEGNNPKLIQKKLDLGRNQYYRDLKDIKAELFSPERIQEYVSELLSKKEYLITEVEKDFNNAQGDLPARVALGRLLKDVIDAKERSLEKLGFIYNQKDDESTVYNSSQNIIEIAKVELINIHKEPTDENYLKLFYELNLSNPISIYDLRTAVFNAFVRPDNKVGVNYTLNKKNKESEKDARF